eukprot:gene26637-4233_t
MSEWLGECRRSLGNSSDFVTGGYLKTEWVSAFGVQGKGSGFTIPLLNATSREFNKAEKDPSKRVDHLRSRFIQTWLWTTTHTD